MIGLREIYEHEKKVGIILSYSLNNENYGYNQKEVYVIKVINGEIVYTSSVYGGIYNQEDDIQKYNWVVVEKVLEMFLNLSLEYTKILIDNLNSDSIGYQIMLQIIDNKINILKTKQDKLSLIKKQ